MGETILSSFEESSHCVQILSKNNSSEISHAMPEPTNYSIITYKTVFNLSTNSYSEVKHVMPQSTTL